MSPPDRIKCNICGCEKPRKEFLSESPDSVFKCPDCGVELNSVGFGKPLEEQN